MTEVQPPQYVLPLVTKPTKYYGTLSPHYDIAKNGKTQLFWKIKAEPVSVYNVSGAGDVVVAMMGVCLSHGLNVLDSAYIANKCAGYTVTQPQTCVVPKDVFKNIYKNYFRGNV